MADNAPVVHEYEPHKQDYTQFVKLVMATIISVIFILVALMAVGFAQSFNVLLAIGGLVVGLGSVTVTLMTGGRNWLPCGVLLVIYFLLTATLV